MRSAHSERTLAQVPRDLKPALPWLIFCVAGLLAVCELTMINWARAPWLCCAGLTLLCAVATGAGCAFRQERVRYWAVIVCWAGTVLAILGLLWAKVYTLDFYHAILAGLLAASLVLASGHAANPADRIRWKILGLAWACIGALLWLSVAYAQNRSGAFHFGIVLNVAMLLVSRAWIRLPPMGIQTVNTMVLLLVGLPVADFFFRPSYRPHAYLDPAKKYYSYASTHGDPAMFYRWCRAYQQQWDLMGAGVFSSKFDPAVRVRLRPGGQGSFFDSRVCINSLGFRGPEFAAAKGSSYRIVVLGESTTFGCTINAEDKPWPEVLERIIQERLRPSRRVEVINAGVPANSLEHCLHRLPREILPLQPDLLISYHGINGFWMLGDSVPKFLGPSAPVYRQRPLKLLGDAEYRLRVMIYKRRTVANSQRGRPGFATPLETKYAKAYGRLMQIAQTNHIRLALANFSMAVNRTSPQDVVAFYRAGTGATDWHIRANAVHSQIVAELARQNPWVCFVDTHPGLDGEHELFIDLVHMTQQGRARLAETMFEAIKPALEEDLGPLHEAEK